MLDELDKAEARLYLKKTVQGELDSFIEAMGYDKDESEKIGLAATANFFDLVSGKTPKKLVNAIRKVHEKRLVEKVRQIPVSKVDEIIQSHRDERLNKLKMLDTDQMPDTSRD